MGDLAREAGVSVPANQRLLGEFAAVVATLAKELLHSKPMVLRWHVQQTPHEVSLVVRYVASSGVVSDGRATWTLVGVLNDGAAMAVRTIHAIAEALDQAQAGRESRGELNEGLDDLAGGEGR